jgi:hypothetical protein
MAVAHGRSTWSLDHMIAKARLRCTLGVIAVLTATLFGCSDRHAAPPPAPTIASPSAATLSQAEVLEIARNAAAKEGIALKDFGPPQTRYELLDGEWRWLVFYPGIEDKPGNFFNVLVNDRTRAADVLLGE